MDPDIKEFVTLAISGRKERKRAGELQSSFKRDKKKQATESLVFVSFAKSLSAIADPFQHTNEPSPSPDIKVVREGGDYYFELGEITDQLLAQTTSDSVKHGRVSGCAISPCGPLAEMLLQKCAKRYDTRDAPVDLVLYYWRHDPPGSPVDFLNAHYPELKDAMRKSPFTRIWVYQIRDFDSFSGEVLWMTSTA